MSEHAFLSDVRLALVLTAARGLLDELRTSVVDESVHEKANALADALHAFEGVGHPVSDPSKVRFPGDMEQCHLEQGGNPHDL